MNDITESEKKLASNAALVTLVTFLLGIIGFVALDVQLWYVFAIGQIALAIVIWYSPKVLQRNNVPSIYNFFVTVTAAFKVVDTITWASVAPDGSPDDTTLGQLLFATACYYGYRYGENVIPNIYRNALALCVVFFVWDTIYFVGGLSISAYENLAPLGWLLVTLSTGLGFYQAYKNA